MRQVLAIARLTFEEGIRMRIVLVSVIVLTFAVLRLPFALHGDETVSGRLQTFLSYGLGALSLFLGLATVFLSCATLSKEIQTRSLHMVVTKPVSRFQILLGKWIGVNLLNVLIVALCGLAIYAFALFIKSREADTFDRDRLKLRDTVWTARVAATPTVPELEAAAREMIDEMAKRGETFSDSQEAAVQRKRQELLEKWRTVPPGERRLFEFQNLTPPEDASTTVQVRFKARGAPLTESESVFIRWWILDPISLAMIEPFDTDQRSGEIHQFLLRGAAIADGRAAVGVECPPPPHITVIHFEGDDALQILYKVGSFEWNYVKTLLLILARVAFLSALGLFWSTFVSFPVAAFCVMSIYLFCIGVPWWLESIGANLTAGAGSAKIDPYGAWGPYIRQILVPLLQLVLPDFVKYDGVGALIDGVYVAPALMSKALTHTLLYGLFLLLGPGWLIFRSREIAEVQV